MTASTIRSAIDATIDDLPAAGRVNSLQDSIAAEWRKTGRADLVHALRQHPTLLHNKSQILNLAIEEYRTNSRQARDTDLQSHCHRFREFGSSVERSIFRQLEAQRYIDSHPELLDYFSTPDWPKAGDQLGEFQVLEEIGIGAAAHVYLCLQTDVGFRQVVIKATPQSSFEASILGRLKHPNIVQIFSTGLIEESNLNYICMPFCGRSTLSDLLDVAFRDGCPRDEGCIGVAALRWMREGELTAEQTRKHWWNVLGGQSYVDGILRIAIQIADALETAHRAGILHGDLKPSNVLLTPEGRPLLLDFNLSQDFISAASVCGGTLPYMPPEYLCVLARRTKFERDLDFNATPDVYSFGALLYELLTGSTPVILTDSACDSSNAAANILAELQHGVPKVCDRNRFVSRKLEAIVLKCLSFDAAKRPAGMAEVKAALKPELNSLAVMGRLARLRPAVFACVVGLPLIALGGVGTYAALKPHQYVVEYEAGMQLAAAGNFDDAVNRFASSVELNPSFAEARFQLGRAHVATGNFSEAIKDFDPLARKNGDVRSMAYIGYCFNKQPSPPAAIPWYELAIANGAHAASVYNNLGASYIAAPPYLPKVEQLRRASVYLDKALMLDPDCRAAKLNLIKCATLEAKKPTGANPWRVWQTAWEILKSSPNDSVATNGVAEWYLAVKSNDRLRTEVSADAEALKKATEAFEHLIRSGRESISLSAADAPRPSTSLDCCYIEPISIISGR